MLLLLLIVTIRRHFYIVNEANCSVLDVDKGCMKPGTHAVIDHRHPSKALHQLWYMGLDGIIHSKLNDFVLECTSKLSVNILTFDYKYTLLILLHTQMYTAPTPLSL